MVQQIYIISSASNPCRYKIGFCSGSKKNLIKGHLKEIPDVKVHTMYEVENCEGELLRIDSILAVYRDNNASSINAHWYECTPESLQKALLKDTPYDP